MAAGNFQNCLPYTLREEGGKSNDPRDPGGRANEGVTQRTYDAWCKARGGPQRDVYLMQSAERDAIYKSEYWNAIAAESLPPGEDLSGFDYAVNSGPKKALSALARANAGSPPLGKVIDNIASERLSFLHGLGTWRAFGKDWGERVARIEAQSLRMAKLPLLPNVAAAKSRKQNSADAAKTIPMASPAGVVAAASTSLHVGPWIGAAIIGVVIISSLICAFNAWRQGQRAATLEGAVDDMLAARRKASAAQQSVAASIAAQEAKLFAAKAAIAGPPQPSAVPAPDPATLPAPRS